MTRRKAVLVVALGVLAVVAAALLWVRSELLKPFDFTRVDDAHRAAYAAFLADLPQQGCVTRDHVRAAARARQWQMQETPDIRWCVAPDNVAHWLRVTVEPALFMSTDDENAALFAFDAEGCRIEWRYANGPGSTCPDN